MKEIKKATSIWRSRGLCIIATTLILWIWGDIAQPQATSCQVGTYDCAGQLYISNGNVGVGTTGPEKKLDVAGTIRTGGHIITNSTNGALVLNAGPADATNVAGVWFRKATTLGEEGAYTDLMRITETGNVGIGTTAPTEKLQVQGNLATSGRVIASGGYTQPGTGGETLRIIRGRVDAGGLSRQGSGYSATRTAVGTYIIAPSTFFSGTVTFVVSLYGANNAGRISAVLSGISGNTLAIYTFNASGAPADSDFTFILIGPA